MYHPTCTRGAGAVPGGAASLQVHGMKGPAGAAVACLALLRDAPPKAQLLFVVHLLHTGSKASPLFYLPHSPCLLQSTLNSPSCRNKSLIDLLSTTPPLQPQPQPAPPPHACVSVPPRPNLCASFLLLKPRLMTNSSPESSWLSPAGYPAYSNCSQRLPSKLGLQ